MSRKFRWFLLGSCAFIVLMGGRETIAVLAGGPQVQSSSPELVGPTKVGTDKLARARLLSLRQQARGGVVAQGDAPRE